MVAFKLETCVSLSNQELVKFARFRLYLIQMSKIAGISASVLDRAFTLLEPDEVFLVDRDQHSISLDPAEKGDSNLIKLAKTCSKLPESFWLHLASIENQPVLVLSCAVDQNQTAFLTFPSTTRISHLEEKLVLLQDIVSNQTPDQTTAILQDLTTSDLKTGTSHHPEQDDFLSIFAELKKSVIKTNPTPPNEGDTQPIRL